MLTRISCNAYDDRHAVITLVHEGAELLVDVILCVEGDTKDFQAPKKKLMCIGTLERAQEQLEYVMPVMTLGC